MNSWQSAGEAHKNKPVVQFLAMVMKLEIITGNWGSLKVKIQQLGLNRPYLLGTERGQGLTLLQQPLAGAQTPAWGIRL